MLQLLRRSSHTREDVGGRVQAPQQAVEPEGACDGLRQPARRAAVPQPSHRQGTGLPPMLQPCQRSKSARAAHLAQGLRGAGTQHSQQCLQAFGRLHKPHACALHSRQHGSIAMRHAHAGPGAPLNAAACGAGPGAARREQRGTTREALPTPLPPPACLVCRAAALRRPSSREQRWLRRSWPAQGTPRMPRLTTAR